MSIENEMFYKDFIKTSQLEEITCESTVKVWEEKAN